MSECVCVCVCVCATPNLYDWFLGLSGLSADAGWSAGKLWRRYKCSERLHSINKRLSGLGTRLPVLITDVCGQHLMEEEEEEEEDSGWCCWLLGTLMFLIRAAVALATSLAACMKCFLATGLLVLLEAALQAWQSVLVCLAITVAAARTCSLVLEGLRRLWQAADIACCALANLVWSTSPGTAATLEGSATPTR